MSTQPPVAPPRLAEDPGPWSVVSSTFSWAGGPGRRRPAPPMGLMLSPPPAGGGRTLVGLEDGHPAAGGGAVRVIAAAREPAVGLRIEGDRLIGVSPGVRRSWSLPDLVLQGEERPEADPAAEAPAQVALGDAGLPEGAFLSPDGGLAAVLTREPRADVVALVRSADGALVRWVRGARAAAWSADGGLLALGGMWGVILAERVALTP